MYITCLRGDKDPIYSFKPSLDKHAAEKPGFCAATFGYISTFASEVFHDHLFTAMIKKPFI